jgi:hypothetical protein
MTYGVALLTSSRIVGASGASPVDIDAAVIAAWAASGCWGGSRARGSQPTGPTRVLRPPHGLAALAKLIALPWKVRDQGLPEELVDLAVLLPPGYTDFLLRRNTLAAGGQRFIRSFGAFVHSVDPTASVGAWIMLLGGSRGPVPSIKIARVGSLDDLASFKCKPYKIPLYDPAPTSA